jgi:hypothetical protein
MVLDFDTICTGAARSDPWQCIWQDHLPTCWCAWAARSPSLIAGMVQLGGGFFDRNRGQQWSVRYRNMGNFSSPISYLQGPRIIQRWYIYGAFRLTLPELILKRANKFLLLEHSALCSQCRVSTGYILTRTRTTCSWLVTLQSASLHGFLRGLTLEIQRLVCKEISEISVKTKLPIMQDIRRYLSSDD